MRKIYEYGNANADAVLIQPVDEHDMAMLDAEFDEIQRLTKADFQLGITICLLGKHRRFLGTKNSAAERRKP